MSVDTLLRPSKDRLVGPVVGRIPPRISPTALTAAAFAVGIVAAVAAGFGLHWWALGLFAANRALDGADGALARQHRRATDLGGYLDLMGDTVVYAAIPIGVAVARGDVWVACAVLLATFYVNTTSWTLIAAIVARPSRSAPHGVPPTTLHMQPGLIEGAETILIYAVLLAVPSWAGAVMWVMAALVGITIIQRVRWAVRSL